MAEKNPHAALKETALSIFTEIAVASARGFNAEKAAHDAFRLAHAFESISDQIEMGELSAEPIAPDKPEFIEVPRLEQTSDEKWRQVMDPITGKPVMDLSPVDRDAFAPNLPENHPINLRFQPRDGKKRKMLPPMSLQLN